MAKKTSFANSMLSKVNSEKVAVQPEPKPQHQATQPEPKPKTKVASTRVGKSPILAYVDKSVKKQIKQWCLDNDITQEQMIIDAVNEFFQKRNKPTIA